MNATIETSAKFEIVGETSATCAAYNESNADAISLGILLPRKPSDRVLAQEAQAVKDNEARERRARLEAAALQELQAVNPTGVALDIEAVYSGGGTYSRGYHSGWKLIIGTGWGQDANRKWMAIGNKTELCVTAKQLGKAQEKIAEVAAVDAAEKARRNAKLNVQQRTEAFIKDNSAFCALVGHTSYNSGETITYGSGYNRQHHYQTAFLVTEDGSVKIGGETYTVAQWTEVYNLRAAQAQAMKALKNSFATISPAS